MLKEYSRHGPTQAFGVVCSPGANSVFDGKFAYVPALEDVLVWDVKKGQMMAMWHETGHRAEVTCILKSPRKDVFAVGYADGSVRLWDLKTGTVIVTFNGHKKSVTVLAFDEQGARLASASQDTEIILWDVEAETGLFRLRGHRGALTALRFVVPPTATSTSTTTAPGYLISGARDTFIKLWDLTTQHCIQTIVAHQSEIWSLDVDPTNDIMLTGTNDAELKAWSIDMDALVDGLRETDSGELSKVIQPLGILPLSTQHRVAQISFHPTESLLAVQSHDRSVEIFHIRTEEEVKKKRTRRAQREREKKRGKGLHKEQEVDTPQVGDAEERQDDSPMTITELFTPYLIVRAGGKIRSFDFLHSGITANGALHMLLAMSNNALEVINVPRRSKMTGAAPEATRVFSVDIPGHRTDVRTVCLSSNDELLASGSNGSLKIWNVRTTACIRTLDCEYAICSTFLPGDRHVAIGTKSGDILIYDLATSSMIDRVEAHTGTVWSMQVRNNKLGMVTGSADKEVKFWDFEYTVGAVGIEGEEAKPVISLVLAKTLKMTDDVLSVRFSPDGKFVAVALLDSTVKVFYQDTLKFFLSLYGHKLPVLAMDISCDSKLIITCSADKNVKIWGLDFGDCHKSIFAHEESIMQVLFEKDSHYFWTVGKDKMLKYWDGDRFENIQKLDGHHGEIWALAVSNEGKFVVTGSHDKSIRIWEKTDEPLILEEERERELEELYEKGIADSMNRSDAPFNNGEDGVAADGGAEAGIVNKQTTETLMAGERIMEALDIADADRQAQREYEELVAKLPPTEAATVPPPTRNGVLTAYGIDGAAYVLMVVQKIHSTALQDALLVLPFSKVVSLMRYLDEWAIKELNTTLISRIMFFLLKTHHHQIVANRIMRSVLVDLRTHLRDALRRQKEEIGYNLAALQYIRQQHESQRISNFLEQENMNEDRVRAKLADGKKRKRIGVRA